MSLEFYVVVQLLIDMEKKRDAKNVYVRRARNNVVQRSVFFYRPIYYNQKSERRENISRHLSISKHAKSCSSDFSKALNRRIMICRLSHAEQSTESVLFTSSILAFSIHIYYQRTLLHFFECDLLWNILSWWVLKICVIA